MRLWLLLILVPLGLALLAMLGVLAPMLRWALRLTIAAGLTLAALLTLPLDADAVWLPLAIFAGALLLLSLGDAGRTGRVIPRGVERALAAVPLDLGPAWWQLRDLADWRTRRRLDAAADTCARYLALADGHEDPTAQLPIKIRKHLPGIVADCVRHSRTATTDERRALIADTVAAIEQVASRAEERRRLLARDAQREFRARQAHLARSED